MLRIDANQAWTPKQAVRILNGMQEKGLNLELVEQPVPAADLEGLRYVTERSDVPVLADEAVFSPADALRILQTRAADLINIKLMKCGGIYNALKIATLAELYGVECMIGCMLEGKVAVNAAAHLACARSVVTKVDLDGPMLCAADPVRGGAVFSGKAGGSGAYSHELRRGASQRSAASAAEPQSSGVKEPAKPRRQEAAPEIPEKLTADYFLGLLRDDPGSAGAARGSGSGK